MRLKVIGLHTHDNPCTAKDFLLLSITFVFLHKNCSERIAVPKVGSLLSQSDQFFFFLIPYENVNLHHFNGNELP